MSHQQMLRDLSGALEKLMAEVLAARLGCKVSTVTETRQRLGKVEHELGNLACACRLAGEMSEETREAFEGVAR